MGRNSVLARAADVALALLLCVVGVVGTTGAGRITDSDVDVDAWAYGLVLVAALALSVRRIWPLATLAVIAVSASTYLVLGYPYGPILVVVLIAVYTVARHVPLRRAASASAAALAVLLVHVFVGQGHDEGLLGVVPGSAWVVVPFALGVTIRLSREAVARSRAELVRRHADDERLRVAREVHDVVGHGLAAINMQAEIALHLLAKRPEQAETALAAISRTSRDALDELRATLAVLRRTRSREDRAPTAGLARLDDLVARMSDTGLPVRVETTGEASDLPAAVDLAAYRVVQESLTNVLRHAGAATATVRLTYRPAELSVEVTDTGGGAAMSPAFNDRGLGIAGMRERVSALGGSFEAGPRAGGGFRVHATLPLGTT